MRNALAILFIVAFFSCTPKHEKALSGLWTIDTLYYGTYDIKSCVLSNAIIFEESDCSLPITKDYYCDVIKTYDKMGTWRIDESEDDSFILEINTENIVFNGRHTLSFRGDDVNKFLKIEVSSDSLYMVCKKALFVYDKDRELVRELSRKGAR